MIPALKGLLRRAACGRGMTPSPTRRGGRRSRYRVCTRARKPGWDQCSSESAPAGPIESCAVEQVRCIGRDPAPFARAVTRARHHDGERLAEPEAGRRLWARPGPLARRAAQRGRAGRRGPGRRRPAGAAGGPAGPHPGRRAARVGDQVQAVRVQRLDEGAARQALAAFDPVWQTLAPPEQARAIDLLVRRADCDGAKGSVAITFHPTGIRALADESASQKHKESACIPTSGPSSGKCVFEATASVAASRSRRGRRRRRSGHPSAA
jgi:site-specific DNA recombinase